MSKTASILLRLGLVFTIGAPLLGLILTACGMISAFHSLSQNGITDPTQLSNRIGFALVATAVGLLGFIPGMGMLIAAAFLIYSERRERLQRAPPPLHSTTSRGSP
jgi:biopolymer transport protein ExbB/TolQ